MEWTNIWGGISGITILYALIMGLLCWFVIGVKGRWVTKSLMITLSIWFAVTLGYTFHNFMGWPSEEEFKTKTSQIIWFQIIEPSKTHRTPGAIYLWVREMNPPEKEKGLTIKELSNPMHWFTYPDPNTAPRSYKIPYSTKMHKKLRDVAEGRGRGQQAYVKIEAKGEKKDGHKKGRGDQERDDGIRIELVDPELILKKVP